MLLKQFPDINWVRQLRNEAAKPADVWMNVALNVTCTEVSRTGVESPYSLFLNNKGFSHCRVNGQSYRIETDTFLLSQPGEQYDLVIDNVQQTEICNVHINKDFFNSWAYTLSAGNERLLDAPDAAGDATPVFFTQLYPKDGMIRNLSARLSALDTRDTIGFEQALNEIVAHLLLSNKDIQSKISRLPFTKASVRTDIYRRLALACDYIRSSYEQAPDLDSMCREIGMSKFHFLRMFKAVHGRTPYQYLAEVRMEKAAALLRTTGDHIYTISDALGFEYSNSFMKAFQKTYGVSPMRYRTNLRHEIL